MADDRPPIYRENGQWIVRASSLGACEASLARHAAGIQGQPAPQAIQEAWRFGTEAEAKIIAWVEANTPWRPLKPGEMRKWGKVDRTGQLCLELPVGKKATVRCHPDGIVEHRETGEQRVLEVKPRARATSEDVEDDPFYTWQFSVEKAVTGLPVLLVVGWKVPGKDEDGNTTDIRVLDGDPEVREMDVKYGVGAVKARVLRLVKMADEAEGKGEWDGACDRAMYPCPFHLVCGGGTGGKKDDYQQVDDGKVELFAELAAEYADHQRRIKATKASADEVKAELMELVGEGKWRGQGWKAAVSETAVEESTRTIKAHVRKTVKIEKEAT